MLDRESPDWSRAQRIFNIHADRVETVTPRIARRVLDNDKTCVRTTGSPAAGSSLASSSRRFASETCSG